MQPPKSSICVICGVRDATTAEHLPPRGFFKGTVGEFRTVPACGVCNNGNSDDDEELRNYISAQVGEATESAEKLWSKGALKSLKRSSRLRMELTRTLHEVQIAAPNGELNTRLAFTVSEALYQRVFERITRGLHFFHIGNMLPPDTRVLVTPLYESPDIAALEIQQMVHFSVAGGAFDYRFYVDPQGGDNGFWLFTMHSSHWVMSVVGNTIEDDK